MGNRTCSCLVVAERWGVKSGTWPVTGKLWCLICHDPGPRLCTCPTVPVQVHSACYLVSQLPLLFWKSTFPVTQPVMFLKLKKDQGGSCNDSASVTCYCTNKIHGQRLCGLSSLHHSFPSALAALTPWLAVEETRQMPALSPKCVSLPSSTLSLFTNLWEMPAYWAHEQHECPKTSTIILYTLIPIFFFIAWHVYLLKILLI